MTLLRSPIHSPIRSPIYSPLVGKWGDADPLGAWLLGATYADYDARKLDRMFQDSTGQTAVTASADKVGLWLDGSQFGTKTLPQLVAGQPELWPQPDFNASTGLNLGAGWTISGGLANAVSASASISAFGALSGGKLYRRSMQVTSVAGGTVQIDLTGASGPTVAGPGTATSYGTTSAGATKDASLKGVAFTGSVDTASVKEIPGNHGSQATSTQRLNLLISGSRYSLTADGTDDNLLSTYLAGAGANSIIIDIDVAASLAATQVIVGMSGSATARLSIGVNTSGQLCAGVGSDANTTIVGTTDWRGARLIAALSADGNTVKLLSAAGEEYSAAQNGSPTTTIPARLAANNNNGTASSFFGGGIARAILAQKALDLATFNAIRNQLLAS